MTSALTVTPFQMAQHVATRFFTTALLGGVLCAAPMAAQDARAVSGASAGLAAGGEMDNYLRYLQTAGGAPLMPWGLRGFAPCVVDSLTAVAGDHPWQSSWLFDSTGAGAVRVLPLDVAMRFNSGYPFGINEGPVWSGRGVTTSVSAGVVGTWGPLTVVVRPIAFWAQNSAFALRPTGLIGDGVFADPEAPRYVDRPQRFGDRAYARLDPGETTIRVDAYGVSAGATSANEWWGPASVFPYIVGNNAAGVPRVFVGTEHPANIYLGRVQARVEYGIESQSDFSPVTGPDTFASVQETGRRRFMSALVLTFSPGGVPGLELGGGRYFHRPWTGRVRGSDLRSPLEGLLTASPTVSASSNLSASELANQLASVWARWVFPHSGLEAYGEYGHEDHNIDKNDLVAELDHSRTAMLGVRKLFARGGAAADGLTAEIFDGTASTVARHRGEGMIYIHTVLRQGHTQEGKIIGSGAGVATPAGAYVAWDRYTRAGRLSAYILRTSEGVSSTTNMLGASGVRFAGPVDVTFGAGVMRTTGGRGWNAVLTLGASTHRLY